MSSEKNQVFYNKPQSHSQVQTRWVIPSGSKINAASMKLLDLKLNPNQPCYFSALIGVYACIKRFQLRVNKQEVNYFFSPQVLPYILASNADNEYQRGVMSVLHGTGNNVVYDEASKLLTLERSLVDTKTVEIRLALLSGFLNAVGVLEDEIEILIDWDSTGFTKYLCPVDVENPVTSINIEAPYLSYEVLINSPLSQPESFQFVELTPDQWYIPAIATSNTQVTAPIVRSNAFNKKVIGRLMLINQPSSIAQATPHIDTEALFSLFGSYMSVPMKSESFQISLDGVGLFTMLNVENLALKLALAVMAFNNVQPHAVSLGHINSKNPILKELVANVIGETVPQLNGFFSYSAVELNQRVNQELALTYSRASDDNNIYPTLSESMILHAIGEVHCVWSRSKGKSYL